MTKVYLMKCGCSNSGAYRPTVKGMVPVCGLHNEFMVVDEPIDLHMRKAECCYCRATTESKIELAFFKYQPSADTDQYYCGCFGWD